MKKRMCLLLLLITLLNLAACKQGSPAESAPTKILAAAETTEMAVEILLPETEPAAPVLLDHPEEGKVCVGFQPTEAGSWRYAVIEDQEAALAACEKAVNAIYSDEWWIKGDKTLGLMVEYKGEIWEFVESGELFCSLGWVKAEDAADLLSLCQETARTAGWKDAVTPEQLTGIVCATLRSGEAQFSLTDAAALDKLERMLTVGQYILGGTGCPFTALLDLELETGETLTIALATDSCGIWMSEGSYYEFANDSQALYDLFGVTLEFGEIRK